MPTKILTGILLAFLPTLVVACGNLEKPRFRSHPYGHGDSGLGVREASTTADATDGRAGPTKRVILVSVDGLASYYLRQRMDQGTLPGFTALQHAGTSTLNARADYDYTITLPNHISILTGRPVAIDLALPSTTHHGWFGNGDVDSSLTIHNAGNPNLTYIASVFDVVHDHGRSTCLYAGKSKFGLFSNSYSGKNGAPDEVGEDNGRNKIDRVMIFDQNTDALMDALEGDLLSASCDFAFIHMADPDTTGHSYGWGSESWLRAVEKVDGWIARLTTFTDPNQTTNPYALAITADHGGVENDHTDPTLPIDYTIPFFIVGPGIPANSDLYTLSGRTDPGDTRPRYSDPDQPVRNSDAANLVTHLLGLPPVPGAFMHDLLK